MTLLLGIVIGLLASHWLEALLLRVVMRLADRFPQVREAVRREARSQGIDLQERGKVIKLSDVDAADALAKPGQLFDDVRIKHGDFSDLE
jgi:hypothetical protein